MKKRRAIIKAVNLLSNSKNFIPVLLVKKSGEKFVRVVYVPVADAKTNDSTMKYINNTFKGYEDYKPIFDN